MRIITRIFAKDSILPISILIMMLVINIAYLFRPISYDDAFFMEQAYWLHKLGYVKTVLFEGLLDWSEREFVYHKLHIWQGSILISLFGLNVHILKLLPVLYLIAFIYIAKLYLSKHFQSQNVLLFFVFLLLTNSFVLQDSLEFRPEIMMMCTGFLSFYFLRNITIIPEIAYFLAGLFAGITALFHLNGLIFIGAGFFLLIYEKRYISIPYFIAGSTLSFSPYFFEMMSVDKLKIFYYQFSNDPAITKKELSPAQWILKVISGPRRFFEHGYEAVYTIFTFTILWLSRKQIVNDNELKILFIYFVLLEILLSLISPGSKSMYLIYHLPYILLLVAVTYNHSISMVSNKYILPSLLIFYVLSQLFHIYAISEKSLDDATFHKYLFDKYQVHTSDKVLAPEPFIFNQIDKAEIHGIHVYDLLSLRHNFKLSLRSKYEFSISK